MRKIYIVIPLISHKRIVSTVTQFVCGKNEKCLDITREELNYISHDNWCYIKKIKDEYRFYTDDTHKLACIIKKIEINTQEFPDTPNATIN